VEVTTHENIMEVRELYADFRRWAEKRGLNLEFLPNSISFGIRLRHIPGFKFRRSNGSVVRNAKLKPEDA
jgi:hypothetical protein